MRGKGLMFQTKDTQYDLGPFIALLTKTEANEFLASVTLAGLSPPIEFLLNRKRSEYAARIFETSNEKRFLGLTTLDGRTAWINLRYLSSARLESKPTTWAPRRPPDCMRMYLAPTGRKIEIAGVAEDYILNIVTELYSLEWLDNRFMSFPDLKGAAVAINIDQLMLVEYPTAWVESAERRRAAKLIEGVPEADEHRELWRNISASSLSPINAAVESGQSPID
jgi:hypothetical protein